MLLYRGDVPVGDPDAVEATLAGNGWRPDWRDGVYPFHHFHSTAHEALACTGGSALLQVGGPEGEELAIGSGDLLVLPAGTGHRRVKASAGFLLVGAYPDGRTWDVCRGAADDEARARIAAVPIPSSDPLQGPKGALPELWRRR